MKKMRNVDNESNQIRVSLKVIITFVLINVFQNIMKIKNNIFIKSHFVEFNEYYDELVKFKNMFFQ